ncbi:MAG: metallophosphoesterase [Lachnospiraceae bacterium]|nr:metallophosphoesterase [Lachnospiraceae bacterium]
MFHKRAFLILIMLTMLGFYCIGASLYLSEYGLTTSFYQISSDKISGSIRIVLLSDLHDSEFGEDNEQLVEEVKAQSPDLILIAGDLVDSEKESTDVETGLISDLSEICPVYVSYGNQEYEHESLYGSDLTALYEAAGAVVLEKEYVDLEIRGQRLRLGGIYGYCLPEMYLASGEADPGECMFLSEFQDTEAYTILMCHMPVCWILNDGLDEWSVDCVMSGHVHGGQMILPFVGGLYGPDFGWFPGRLEGLFYSSDEEKVLVLTRGLGSTESVPRFNNVPEIVVTDIGAVGQ